MLAGTITATPERNTVIIASLSLVSTQILYFCCFTSNRLMKNASLGNSERAGAGIETPLDADSEEAAPWGALDRAAGASG